MVLSDMNFVLIAQVIIMLFQRNILKKIDGKVGDTISIAYELSNVENNHPIFVLFKNDSIGKKYKHEFQ